MTAYHESGPRAGGAASARRPIPCTRSPSSRAAARPVTWFLPEEQDFKFRVARRELSVAFGGRAAEELVLQPHQHGGSQRHRARDRAGRADGVQWGMSDKLGPMNYGKGEETVFLGREIVQHRDYSDATAQKIDDEINRLIKGAYERRARSCGRTWTS